MTPLGGKDHQVEGANRLDLVPLRAAATRLIRRFDRLDHHALVARSQRLGPEEFGLSGVGSDQSRDSPRAGDPLQHGQAFVQRGIDQIGAIDVEHIEEERLEPDSRANLITTEAAHRLLEDSGPTVIGDSQRLTIEHHACHRQAADHGDDLRESGRDLVEVAGIDLHVVTDPMDLDPRAVELPFNRRQADGFDRRADRGGCRGEHWLNTPARVQADLGQRCVTALMRNPGDNTQVTGHHRRPAHTRGLQAEGLGDRIGNDPGERTVAHIAEKDPAEELALGGGRLSEEFVQPIDSTLLGPDSFDLGQLIGGLVNRSDCEERLVGGSDRPSEIGPADADATLA